MPQFLLSGTQNHLLHGFAWRRTLLILKPQSAAISLGQLLKEPGGRPKMLSVARRRAEERPVNGLD
jgi:hypothetical protein